MAGREVSQLNPYRENHYDFVFVVAFSQRSDPGIFSIDRSFGEGVYLLYTHLLLVAESRIEMLD